MKTIPRVGALAAGFAILFAGCSSSSPAKGGSGGQSSSSGGTTGSGGSSSGSGGKQGSGGTTSSGGSQGSGGKVGSGGTTGSSSGGATASGGATGSGGMTGSGSGGATMPGSGGAAMGGAGGGSTSTGGGGGATGAGGANGGSTGTSGVTVQLDKTEQTIEGFGLNTALSSATLDWDKLFTNTSADSLGLSIVRVGMNSDGSLSGDLSGAKSRNVKVIGSVWTAPKEWKDNNNENNGGHLVASHYDDFASRIAMFAQKQGVYAMSAANEPDFASCPTAPCTGPYATMLYTANEMVAFVKVLKQKFKDMGVTAKLIAPEPSEWVHLWSNASATGSTVANHPNSTDPLMCGCFSNDPSTTGCASKCASGDGYDYGHWLAKDTDAWAAVDIIGTHEYDSYKAAPWPADVDGGKRSKEIWETEVSGVKYWPEEGPSTDIKDGLVVAGWIHSAVVVGQASAWLYWWYQPTNTDNEGVVLSNGTITKRYYTIGNFSKFVRPGYVMVDVTGNSNADVLLSAYTGTGGLVIVAINKSMSAVTMPITIAGGTAPASCTPNVTSANDDLKAGTAVPVAGGVLSASLAASTVTTFVCK